MIIGVLVVEGGVRVYIACSPYHSDKAYFSSLFGWGCNSVIVGSEDAGSAKILVIGDSFTQRSDGKRYYDYLVESLPGTQLFEYGCGAYGWVQEYMVLDHYIYSLKPDLIIWQLCDNDIVNNDYALESASFMHNDSRTRPYYEEGRLIWRYPRRYFGWLNALLQSSLALRILQHNFDLIAIERAGGSIAQRLERHDPMIRNALRNSAAVMQMFKKRADSIPVVAFTAKTFLTSPYLHMPVWVEKEYASLCASNQILYVDDIEARLLRAVAQGESINLSWEKPASHWNEAGHRIVAEGLRVFLQKHGLAPHTKQTVE